MSLRDSVENALNKGVTTAKSAVAGVAVEQTAFIKGFSRMCSAGFARGWNEANGGNVSYRLTTEEVEQVRTFFYPQPSSWINFPFDAPILAHSYFLITAAGCYLANVEKAPAINTGIIEINGAGNAYRVVWGLKNGGQPTSEFPSHALCHAERMHATAGRARVLYHAHPSSVVALTLVVPADSRALTRLLWSALNESILMFPEGLGVLPWMMPGSVELAQATAQKMATHKAVVWTGHGVFASGSSFESAFGLMDTIDKAAGIACSAYQMCGTLAFPNAITDEQLASIADFLNLPLNRSML